MPGGYRTNTYRNDGDGAAAGNDGEVFTGEVETPAVEPGGDAPERDSRRPSRAVAVLFQCFLIPHPALERRPFSPKVKILFNPHAF
ncbi:hypothetical protein GCM10008922_35990 [Faecalicatena contorta]